MNGDVSDSDRKLAIQLMEYEKHVDGLEEFTAGRKAQSYVCLAHDWYQIGMEEEAGRLLLKAEEIFPGYFKNLMIKHIEESADFDKLVKSFTVQLMWTVASQIKDK